MRQIPAKEVARRLGPWLAALLILLLLSSIATVLDAYFDVPYPFRFDRRHTPLKGGVMIGTVTAIDEAGTGMCIQAPARRVCAIPQLAKDAPLPQQGTRVKAFFVPVPEDSQKYATHLAWVAVFPV